MKSGIYKIENRLTGRRYIGSAVSIKRRLITHRYLLKKGIHRNAYLQASWNKYGEGAFIFAEVLICRREDLVRYEQAIMDFYRPTSGLYNLAPKANSQLGFRHSAETLAKFKSFPQLRAGKRPSKAAREAISAGLRGHTVSTRHREVVGARYRGAKLSPEHREKLSAAKRGFKWDADVVLKRNMSNTGKKRSPEAIANMREAQRKRREREAQPSENEAST